MNIAFTPATRIVGTVGARLKMWASNKTKSWCVLKTASGLAIGVLAVLSTGACKQQQPADKPVQYSMASSLAHAAATVESANGVGQIAHQQVPRNQAVLLPALNLKISPVADQLIIKVESVDSAGTHSTVRNDKATMIKIRRHPSLQHQVIVTHLSTSAELRSVKPAAASPITVSM